MIPLPLGIPGIKLGLANLAVVLPLYLYAPREAVLVSVVRIFIVGFMFGNLFSIFFYGRRYRKSCDYVSSASNWKV